MEEYETAKAYIVQNPNALEDPEKAVELQRSIVTMEQQLQELDVQTKTIERQLMQESTQLDPFSSALGQEPQQANPMMAEYGTELPKAMFGFGKRSKEAKQMIKDDPMSFARLMSGDVSAAANFARYGGALPVFETQGELTGSDAWGYQGDDADGNPIIGEREPVFATYDPNRQQGADAHSNAFNVMASKDFDPVRQLWIDKYRETAAQNPTGSKRWLLNKPDGTAYSDAELFMIFNKMNQYLSTVASGEGGDIGSVFKADASGNTDALAKKYGYGEKAPTEEEIRIFQGMYQSLNNAKIEDQTGLLDQIVTTPLGQAQTYTQKDIDKMKQNGVWTDEKVGDPKMVDANGNNVSFVDGKLGHTTGGQFYRAENKVNIDEKKEEIKVECDEETRLAKTKECVEQGKRFDLSICDCAEIPGDFKEPKYPPYETFPQDDLLVASKSAQLAGLQQINPVRQPVLDPVLSNPMYVDPRQALSTMEATAAAAIRANPDQATAIMGKMQDASEKIINEHHAMNTKIYNNAQNVNVPLINDAAERKSEAFKNYMDEANTAQENFMVSQMELTDNLVDAVNTQMSNADEMYIRNLENPNFFYSPQAHNVEYYNQRELDGKVVNQNPIDAELAEYQRIKSMDPEFADLYYKNKYSAKNMENTNNSSVDVTRPSDEENAKLGIETKRNVIRQKDLLRSKRELRKWIMGL